MTESRRGSVLLAATVVLAVTSLGVATVVTAGGDDARLSTLRLDSMRALYAAESGAEAAVDALLRDPGTPFLGPITLPDGSIATVDVPFGASPNPPGTLRVTGSAGEASRRIEVTVQ